MAGWTILIRLIEAITFPQNSRRGRIPFTARFHTTTRRERVIDPKRRELFHGSMKRIKAPLFRLARADGSPFAKVIASRTRNGKMLALSVPIIGSTFLVTNGQNLISTK